MRSLFWLQPFPKAVCRVQGHVQVQPLEDCSQHMDLSLSLTGGPKDLTEGLESFPPLPQQYIHQHIPHFLFPAKVWLQTRRHKPAGMGSRQSSSCWLWELLVPSAVLSTYLLPSPLAELAQKVSSSVLEVSSLSVLCLISWHHLSQREAPRPKSLGRWWWCCWSPLYPWHGDRDSGEVSRWQLPAGNVLWTEEEESWQLIAPQADVDFRDFLKIGVNDKV